MYMIPHLYVFVYICRNKTLCVDVLNGYLGLPVTTSKSLIISCVNDIFVMYI